LTCYENGLTDDVGHLIDEITAAVLADDDAAIANLYNRLPVPPRLTGGLTTE